MTEFTPKVSGSSLLIDLGRCIGCNACVAACIAENRLEQATLAVEEGPRSVMDLQLRTFTYPVEFEDNGRVHRFVMHNICMHCEWSPCVAICPSGASYKREDGIVLVNHDKCIGCQYCVYACPYNARFLDPVLHSIDKCTYCEHRLAEGKLPACVETCPTGARVFGPREEVLMEAEKRRSRHEERFGTPFAVYGNPSGAKTSTIYLGPKKVLDKFLPPIPYGKSLRDQIRDTLVPLAEIAAAGTVAAVLVNEALSHRKRGEEGEERGGGE